MRARPSGFIRFRPPPLCANSRAKPMVTDGPFAETREMLGGYEIVECQDLDEAIAIAKRFPALRVGFAMEVRRIRE
jgi:hypothetical protein